MSILFTFEKKCAGRRCRKTRREPRMLKDPVLQIAVSELADSSINHVSRPWVKASDYWDVLFDNTEKVKKRSIPKALASPSPQA